MKFRILSVTCMLVMLGACSPSVETTGRAGNVPEAVLAVAAPYQNLATARLRPEDGCYWYLHSGPVETTLIPLRSVDGRPICTSPEA